MSDLISRQIIKAQMMKYGFRAPDMTVTEFVEDCLPSAQQDCSDCKKHGGDWDCDYVHCHKGESAQSERKKGKWDFIGDQVFVCTECGACYSQSQFEYLRTRKTDPEFPYFCPMCGADNRGEE